MLLAITNTMPIYDHLTEVILMSSCILRRSSGLLTRSNTNLAVQLRKKASGVRFRKKSNHTIDIFFCQF